MAAAVGLSGGIGCGKSTVASLIANNDVLVLDADQVARTLTAPGSEALDKITNRFGIELLNVNGALDRKALRAIIFNDASQRQWLEQLLHPAIQASMAQAAEQCPQRFCMLEIPLLIETGRYRDMAQVVVVHCNKQIRIQRLIANRNIKRETIERIMASQANAQQRLAVADYVIDNSGQRQALAAQVADLIAYLKNHFREN